MISGSDVECNESSLTGESDDEKKDSSDGDVFLISGSTLSMGCAKMLVTNMGFSSRWGKTRENLAKKSPDTPLQKVDSS
jgi:magnesium-transporting ATPase (P-type)